MCFFYLFFVLVKNWIPIARALSIAPRKAYKDPIMHLYNAMPFSASRVLHLFISVGQQRWVARTALQPIDLYISASWVEGTTSQWGGAHCSAPWSTYSEPWPPLALFPPNDASPRMHVTMLHNRRGAVQPEPQASKVPGMRTECSADSNVDHAKKPR